MTIGDVMLDEYIWGHVSRISPEAPVPVVEVERRTYVPGGAANTAAGIVALGGLASLGGVVGRDQQADRLREALTERGVDHGGLIGDETRTTTTKTRIVANSQQVVRADLEGRASLGEELEDRLIRWAEGELVRADAIILSDYAKGVVSPRVAQRVIELARAHSKPVVVDPKGVDFTKYRGATVITPNIHEAERAAHVQIQSDEDLLEIGRRLSAVLDGCALLVTRGAQGMLLFQDGREPIDVPAVAQNVFDVTGAGDTVVSTLAMALGRRTALEPALQVANTAAGIAVGKVGTSSVTLDELRS